jgi:ribokinase
MAPLIRVIGSLNADMVSVTPRFPEAGETLTAISFTTSAGGKGANQAVACGRLSRAGPSQQSSSSSSSSPVKVEMMGAVGGLDAHFYSLLQPTLEKSGVDTSHIRTVDDAHTGVAVIIVDNSAGGENRILFSPGANYSGMQPIPDVLGLALAAPMPDVIVLQAEIPIETVIGVLKNVMDWKQEARRNGKAGIDADVEVIFNPAPAPPGGLPEEIYPAIDHLVMNETECELMAPSPEKLQASSPSSSSTSDGAGRRGNVAEYFHNLGVTYVLVTLGAKGVWYSAGDKAGKESTSEPRYTNEIPAAKVEKVTDTTAAGDTFVGGYAVQIARWREEQRKSGKSGIDISAEEKKARYQQVTDEAVRMGTQASARCVERQGAMDSIPWEDEVF